MTLLFDTASWMMNQDGAYLMLRCDRQDAIKVCEMMKAGKKYKAEVKEYRKKRSLDANAYFWSLAGKVAAQLNITKEEVYRALIPDVGDNYEVLPVREEAVDKWIEAWEGKGLGWVCQVMGKSKLNGYVNVITYYGSSTYDSAQMARLIDLIIKDCKEIGIETATPQELSLLLEDWK